MDESNKKQKKILVADDQPELRMVLAERLKRRGYDVEVAADGLEALEKAKEFKPDLVILDVMMPKMDGFKVLERFKKDEEMMDVPVIMLTGKKEVEDIQHGISAYAEKYFIKPYAFDELVAEVELSFAAREKKHPS